MIISEALIHGEISRGAAASLINKPEGKTKHIVKELTDRGLLSSKTEKAPYSLLFQQKLSGIIFLNCIRQMLK